jgi:hypothetical protein
MINFLKNRFSVKKTIEQIHNEFDTAGERLLCEAKELLSKESDTNKGERLKKIGFRSSLHAVKADNINTKRQIQKEIATSVEYYAHHYPFNKYINDDEVNKICKKYGLLCGPASNYKDDMPDNNLVEIERFSLREEDMNKIKYGYFKYDDGHLVGSKEPTDLYGYTVFNGWRFNHDIIRKDISETHHFEKPEFKICAPQSHFDMTNMEKKGHFLSIHVPDPIVLQPVTGGYLIVTKWGLEASDELVVNKKDN